MAGKRAARRSVADRILEEKRKIAAETHGTISDGRWAWDWTKSLLVALGLFLLIRTFLVEAFRIPTGSMEQTLLVGDFLLVNKAAVGGRVPFTSRRVVGLAPPQTGDIVVFSLPHDQTRTYVKRIVASGGDVVAMRAARLHRNGHPVQDPAAHHAGAPDLSTPAMQWQCRFRVEPDAPCAPTRDNWGPLRVPHGSFMLLGDNRDNSEDSRYWGFVPRSSVRGTPLVIYFSYEPTAPVAVPWLGAVRWERIGRRVH